MSDSLEQLYKVAEYQFRQLVEEEVLEEAGGYTPREGAFGRYTLRHAVYCAIRDHELTESNIAHFVTELQDEIRSRVTEIGMAKRLMRNVSVVDDHVLLAIPAEMRNQLMYAWKLRIRDVLTELLKLRAPSLVQDNPGKCD